MNNHLDDKDKDKYIVDINEVKKHLTFKVPSNSPVKKPWYKRYNLLGLVCLNIALVSTILIVKTKPNDNSNNESVSSYIDITHHVDKLVKIGALDYCIAAAKGISLSFLQNEYKFEIDEVNVFSPEKKVNIYNKEFDFSYCDAFLYTNDNMDYIILRNGHYFYEMKCYMDYSLSDVENKFQQYIDKDFKEENYFTGILLQAKIDKNSRRKYINYSLKTNDYGYINYRPNN